MDNFIVPEIFDYWSYTDYMSSEKWDERKAHTLRRDGNKCAVCGATDDLVIHHVCYSRFGNESNLDLVTLCDKCHKDVHELVEYAKQKRLTLDENMNLWIAFPHMRCASDAFISVAANTYINKPFRSITETANGLTYEPYDSTVFEFVRTGVEESYFYAETRAEALMFLSSLASRGWDVNETNSLSKSIVMSAEGYQYFCIDENIKTVWHLNEMECKYEGAVSCLDYLAVNMPMEAVTYKASASLDARRLTHRNEVNPKNEYEDFTIEELEAEYPLPLWDALLTEEERTAILAAQDTTTDNPSKDESNETEV